MDPNDGPEWEARGYRDNDKKWREDVRKQFAHGRYADGTEGKDRYGGDPANAHVGHVFGVANGGANALGNAFMQDGPMNSYMKNNHDELNAALVGYAKTTEAMKVSRTHGANGGLNEGRWAEWEDHEVVDLGKGRFKKVGVLTKKEGGIDNRCAAVKRHLVKVDEYGQVHGLKERIIELEALDKDVGRVRSLSDDLARMRIGHDSGYYSSGSDDF